MSWRDGRRDRPEFNQVKLNHPNVSCRSWVLSVEVHYEFWCVHIVPKVPRCCDWCRCLSTLSSIVASGSSFCCLGFPPLPTPLCHLQFLGVVGGGEMPSDDGVWWCRRELDHIKDWVKLFHGLRQVETIGVVPNLPFNGEGP